MTEYRKIFTELQCVHCQKLLGFYFIEKVHLIPVYCIECVSLIESELDGYGARGGEEFEVDDPVAETETHDAFLDLLETQADLPEEVTA